MSSKYLESVPHSVFNVCNVEVGKGGGFKIPVQQLMNNKLSASEKLDSYSNSEVSFDCEYVASNLLPGFTSVDSRDVHPLVQTIYSPSSLAERKRDSRRREWNSHQVVMLSPDDIWLTIAARLRSTRGVLANMLLKMPKN
ncbi:Domain of unknown function (DUF4419) [Orpheovirus IHUMI-LCC2]|uniref:Uncharacterized protein n=1 Tax=Orpheovirus IHUMI-LCC2 TaxID=2023057 RepID=A0A2I2L5S5_9VIRU|nr:Domain of unknown function (DUF4419) [Orpheovirus IHUMI-LCC2]SNW62898.1 Domain of unknown function (DUF4419) [Orpheovirus IHUMI-LCC2]